MTIAAPTSMSIPGAASMSRYWGSVLRSRDPRSEIRRIVFQPASAQLPLNWGVCSASSCLTGSVREYNCQRLVTRTDARTAMPLRPPEFEIDPDNPYERDTLGRQRRVEALCNLIRDEEAAAVVSVDGGFGTGKSVFLKMCAACLRKAEIEVVEFNAWQQGHTGDPLIDLVSALASALSSRVQKLKKIAFALAQRFATNALEQVVAAATVGQVDLGKLASAGGG